MSGEGPIPVEHYYGRLSEEFGGVLPTVIWQEQQRLPVGFLETILEYRAYAGAYHANEADPKGWNASEMRRLVQEIQFELVAEETKANG